MGMKTIMCGALLYIIQQCRYVCFIHIQAFASIQQAATAYIQSVLLDGYLIVIVILVSWISNNVHGLPPACFLKSKIQQTTEFSKENIHQVFGQQSVNNFPFPILMYPSRRQMVVQYYIIPVEYVCQHETYHSIHPILYRAMHHCFGKGSCTIPKKINSKEK